MSVTGSCPPPERGEPVVPADNWFDGVRGGRLWRRGHPVEIPVPLLPLLRSGLSGGSVA
jgi:WhiB family redox-sensing transcriptional regulator